VALLNFRAELELCVTASPLFISVHRSRNLIKRTDTEKYYGFLKDTIFLHLWLFPFYLSIISF